MGPPSWTQKNFAQNWRRSGSVGSRLGTSEIALRYFPRRAESAPEKAGHILQATTWRLRV
jgi:hypothetical protein